jgi:hypothetical protein
MSKDDNKPVCGMGQARKLTLTTADIGKTVALFSMGRCDCKSCCRRLTLFTEGTPAVSTDEWVVKVIARITFGIQEYCIGANVEVDFKQGVVLDLPGDYVDVKLEVIEVIGAPIERVFGAFVACCGAGAARGIATRTGITVSNPGGGAISFIDVPPFAYAVDFADPSGAMFVVGNIFVQLGSGTALNAFIDTVTGEKFLTDPGQNPWRIAGGVESIGVIIAGAATTFEPVFYIGV